MVPFFNKNSVLISHFNKTYKCTVLHSTSTKKKKKLEPKIEKVEKG